jgi:hypothetical protein
MYFPLLSNLNRNFKPRLTKGERKISSKNKKEMPEAAINGKWDLSA